MLTDRYSERKQAAGSERDTAADLSAIATAHQRGRDPACSESDTTSGGNTPQEDRYNKGGCGPPQPSMSDSFLIRFSA
jgi:hypothetical protein